VYWCGVSVTPYANVFYDCVCIGVSLYCLLQLVVCIRVPVTVRGTMKASLNTATTISFMRRADHLSRGVLSIVVSLSLIKEPQRRGLFSLGLSSHEENKWVYIFYYIYQPIVTTKIITTASTFRDCFGQIGTRPRDWQVGFPHFPCIPQTTFNSVRLCFSSSDVHCSRAFLNETLVKTLNVFYAFKRVCILLIIRFYSSYAL
jgi:hypothetical protein